MTITLSPETEERLRRRAERDHSDPSTIAEALIADALEREERDRQEAMEGVRRGDQAAADGRERPLSEFFAAQRAKHNLPTDWPHAPVQPAGDA